MEDLTSFSKLDLQQKVLMLISNGRFLTSTQSKNKAFTLYFLNGYFVEVILNLTKKELKEITPFKKGSRFEKYLSDIKLPF
jgi:hypothetical protein